VLALTRTWWGPPGNEDPQPASTVKEPWLIQTAIVLLVVLILAAGIWPNLLDMVKWGTL
jgi:formate hydrogenlyase subunit 3/multisubunit Na+/H+ antiporter MnhD subunit